MGWKLFLDDVRNPDGEFADALVARTFREAVTLVQQHGIPEAASLDYDLSAAPNAFRDGRDFLEWFIAELAYNCKNPDELKLLVFHTSDTEYARRMEFLWKVAQEQVFEQPHPAQVVIRPRSQVSP